MIRLIRIALYAFSAGALAAAAAFTLDPLGIAAQFGIAPVNVSGMGTLRADLAALFAIIGGFTLAGLRPGARHWLTVPLVIVAAILALRLLHLQLDGVSSAALRSSLVEFVALALLFQGRRMLAANDKI